MGKVASTLSRIGYEGSSITNKISRRVLPGWQGKFGYGQIFNKSQAAVRKKLDEKWGVEPKEVSREDPAVRYEGEEAVPEAPAVVPPVTPMPDPGDPFVRATTRRRSVQSQLARRGRMSTILSQSEPLGG